MFSRSSIFSRAGIRFAAAGVFAIATGAAFAAPYQSYKTATCPSASTCYVNFAAAPAGQRLVITNVACRYTFPASSVLTSADLVTNGSGVRDILMPVGVSAVFGGESVYAANNATLFHVPAGSTVRSQMTINPAGNIAMVCKIAGTSEAP